VGREIFVDGYNVIQCAPSFQAARMQSLAAARDQLLALLHNRYRHTPHQVIVVFDGNETLEQVCHERRIRVIYSRHGETADSVITRLAASARAEGREIEIYSDDIEVRQAASPGGTAQTTAYLEHQVYAAPRDVERRARHRIAMRRRYGLDSNYIDEEEDEPPRSPGKKKKKKRR
jgi:hypothetical protein